jgi:predicted TIM-barrel fold metal-dependent hydrolase
VIIDCHTHILYTGADPGARVFMREMCQTYFQMSGALPTGRPLRDSDWADLERLFQPILPEVSISDHVAAGVDRIVALAVAPSNYTKYETRGLWDPTNVTDMPLPHSLDQVNDRLAQVVRMHPDRFIGFAAVNPLYKGVRWAVEELERATTELGLSGLKLYPGYDHYSPNDRDLAWPIWRRAAELGVPVMIHQARSTVSEFKMAYGFPHLLDDVAREFPGLRILVCHMGFPWMDECAALLAKHQNLWCDLSGVNSRLTRREMFQTLSRSRRFGVPTSRFCWGTDYPCLAGVDVLLDKFTTLNEEAERLNVSAFSDREMDGMLGGNFLRFLGAEAGDD